MCAERVVALRGTPLEAASGLRTRQANVVCWLRELGARSASSDRFDRTGATAGVPRLPRVTMHTLYTYLEDNPGRRPERLHELSHGEGFLAEPASYFRHLLAD